MPLISNLDESEMCLVEILRHPVWASEFIKDLDLLEGDEPWKYELYQEEVLCDFSTYVSLRAARSIGKTEVLIFGRVIWHLINNFYPDPLLFTAPNKVHLQVPFDKLTRFIKSNSLLQHYVDRSAINNSDYIIRAKNGFQFIGRIAGKSGSGINIIGLHIPFIIIDECIVGTQKIKGINTNKYPRNLKVGDTVLSWSGENIEEDRIKSIQKVKRNQKVLEIVHENGKMKVGENHRIYTDGGYKQANELIVGENIYTYKGTTSKHFESWEIDFIKAEISKSIPVYEIAKKLSRSTQSIFRKIDHLGLSVREIFDSVDLTEEEYQIILGSALGDGSIQSELNRARYTTNHSLKQKDYVDWMINKLQRIVRTPARISKNGGWGTYSYSFGTIGHPKILEIFNELYLNNKKTVTREYLEKLSPLALAVWYMDDGSESGMFSTHSFSKEENIIISEWLKEKYNIDSKVYQDSRHEHLYFIDIHNWSLKTLRDIIKPYVPECMQYKIGNGKYNNIISEIPEKISEDITTLVKSKVLSIRDVWRTKADYLYSIEVEKNHNYFVNDVLTKNSGYYPYGTFLELMPTFNTFQPGCQLIIAGTPDGRRDRSVNYYADEIDPEFTKHRVSAYENPRFSEEDEKQAIIRYGGEESEDFAHYVLGEHGNPVFSMFSRENMLIEHYPLFTGKYKGKDFANDPHFIPQLISSLPSLPNYYEQVIFGVDLGYVEPSEIHILYQTKGRWYFHSRIELGQVDYPLQEKLLDLLDSKFSPSVIGIDEGGVGKNFVQHLLLDDEYINKNYNNKIIPIKFGGTVSIGQDENGEDIKVKTKQLGMQRLQSATNNKEICYSSQDEELISELERTTYSKTASGEIQYFTESADGSNRNEDHNIAALMCATLAWYTKNEVSSFEVKQKKLMNKFQWWTT